MTPRRAMALAAGGCVSSGAAILLANDRTWATVDRGGPPVDVARADLVSSLAPWALVALAGAVAILATRRWGRVPVGLALAVAGGAAAWVALDVVRDTEERAWRATAEGGVRLPIAYPVHETAWPWVTLAAGVVLLATGLYTAVRGPSWPALGSRYDAPQRRDDAWAALDRGEDPTA